MFCVSMCWRVLKREPKPTMELMHERARERARGSAREKERRFDIIAFLVLFIFLCFLPVRCTQATPISQTLTQLGIMSTTGPEKTVSAPSSAVASPEQDLTSPTSR
jgi:hypothetical protein